MLISSSPSASSRPHRDCAALSFSIDARAVSTSIANPYPLLDAIVSRVLRCLERDGLLIRGREQPWLDLEARDAHDALGAASIQYRIAVGPQAGRKVLTLKLALAAATSSVPKPFTVARDGFSLNAAVACAPHQRDRIERLCRYITRPALALERLSTNGAGQVVYQLTNRQESRFAQPQAARRAGYRMYPVNTPYRDGTTHFVVFEPIEFLARLAALVPRPRGNLVRYHGILAPNAKHRSAVVPNSSKRTRRRRTRAHPLVQALGGDRLADPDAPTAPMSWMERRVTYHCAECSRLICRSARTAAVGCASSPMSPVRTSFRESERSSHGTWPDNRRHLNSARSAG